MPCDYPLKIEGYVTPETLVKNYRLVFNTENGELAIDVKDNYQRFNVQKVLCKADKVTFIPLETYGAQKCNVFSIDIL